MDMFDFMVQSSGNLNLYIKGELPYRWCNGCVVDCGFVSESDNVTDWGDMSIRGLLRCVIGCILP